MVSIIGKYQSIRISLRLVDISLSFPGGPLKENIHYVSVFLVFYFD